jgi:hypothetical protein
LITNNITSCKTSFGYHGFSKMGLKGEKS